MKGLTTHILDLTHGHPASEVAIELYRWEGSSTRRLLNTAATNADGRLDDPLLTFDRMQSGEYELFVLYRRLFQEKKGLQLSDPAFLDKVAVRVGISNLASHYHVPLLVSPWGYQVYRGS
ncbi:hydroxyisourate hydrolase [Ectobacillus funiculus]